MHTDLLNAIATVSATLNAIPGLRFIDLEVYRAIINAKPHLTQRELRARADEFGSFAPMLRGLEAMVSAGLIAKLQVDRQVAYAEPAQTYAKPAQAYAEPAQAHAEPTQAHAEPAQAPANLDPFTGLPVVAAPKIYVEPSFYEEDDGCHNVF